MRRTAKELVPYFTVASGVFSIFMVLLLGAMTLQGMSDLMIGGPLSILFAAGGSVSFGLYAQHRAWRRRSPQTSWKLRLSELYAKSALAVSIISLFGMVITTLFALVHKDVVMLGATLVFLLSFGTSLQKVIQIFWQEVAPRTGRAPGGYHR